MLLWYIELEVHEGEWTQGESVNISYLPRLRYSKRNPGGIVALLGVLPTRKIDSCHRRGTGSWQEGQSRR